MAKAPSPAASAKAAVKKAAPKAKAAAAKAVKPVKLKAETTAESIKEQASAFAGRAGDKARDYANTGKDKATDALDGISGLVDDLAKTVDERLGKQYGDYARRAADAVSGAADKLKHKQVDDLIEDTRRFVREKPAIAIGAAAAIGFVLTRLFRSGSSDRDDA